MSGYSDMGYHKARSGTGYFSEQTTIFNRAASHSQIDRLLSRQRLCFSFCHSRREAAFRMPPGDQKQIPCGNDRKKSKGDNSWRFKDLYFKGILGAPSLRS